MKTKVAVLMMVLGMLFPGFVGAAEVQTKQVTVEKMMTAQDFVKTADNFIVLFDASGTMAEPYKDSGMKKIDVAKKILKDEIETLPNLGYNAGLYLYTPFKAYYPVGPYDKSGFEKAVDSLPGVETAGPYKDQPTPLGEGIQRLDEILPKLSGQTVVFLFSDGQYTLDKYNPVQPVEAAKRIAAKYPVCYYIISTARTAEQRKTLADIASVNQCSRVETLEQVAGRPECTTGAVCTIVAREFPKYETVTKVVGMKVNNILFGFDKSDILPEYNDDLDLLGKFLVAYSEAYVILSGYTDSTFTQEYNLGLSRERAESVRDYLTRNFNIEPERIVMNWYGELNPIATNDTVEGRSKNRRVEIRVAGLQ